MQRRSILKRTGVLGLAALLSRAKVAWAARPTPEAQLRAIRAKLISTARPTVLVLREWPGPDRSSRSHFGGLPDLPRDLDWPTRAATGKPMSFIAQIDLSDLPPVAATVGLPAKGVLWFFADLNVAGQEPDAIRVLFRPDADGSGPERPAPPDLGRLTEGRPYAWLPPGDPATRIDTRSAISFRAVVSYDSRFGGLEYDGDDEPLDALFDGLRDAALRRVFPVEPPSSSRDWYALLSTWESEAWPRAGIFAELAVGAALDAVPHVYPRVDGQVKWTPEALAIRAGLEAEARTEQARWTARRYEALSGDDRKAVRAWIEAFVARAAVLTPEMTDGGFPPTLHSVTYKIAKTPAFAVNLIQAQGGSAMALLPESFGRPLQHGVRVSDYDQMLGYGESPQDAPETYRDHVLLLQISANACIPWLDQAIMHFWITRSDLAARRFDRVVATLEGD